MSQTLQSQLSLSVVKKSDLLSSVLLSMYQSGRSSSLPTAMRFGENLAMHVGGNVLANVLGPNKFIAQQLDQYLTGDEVCTALVYLGSSLFKKKSITNSAFDAVAYVVSEKVSKMVVSQFFGSNQLFLAGDSENL